MGVVVRSYIDYLKLLIPTALVSVLFCSSICTFCSFFLVFRSFIIVCIPLAQSSSWPLLEQ